MTHNDFAHADFHCAFVTISKTLYIRRFAHHLRQYIEYCSQCLLNQIKRHKSYKSLVFISFSKISFHIKSMNFIFTLLLSKKFDIILTIIDKFFKEKLLMSDRNTWKIMNWALNLLRYLQLCNWELSRAIISDRDFKFQFEWKWIFKSLNTNLLISTVYHSQTNELFERINQTIEIALRYFLISDSNFSLHQTLLSLQHSYMNIVTSTKYSSNQVLYEFNISWKMSALSKDRKTKFRNNREIIRVNVIIAIVFVNVRFKVIYDSRHKSITFNTDDKVYRRLNHEFSLSEKENFKLFNQRANLYLIKRKVDSAAYELKLSAVREYIS
jgi:hypothetical protein